MKKKLVLIISLLLVVGCGGVQHASVKGNAQNGISFNSQSISIMPPPSPGELGGLMIDQAIAESIKNNAERVNADNGEVQIAKNSSYPYCGVVINDDPVNPLWVSHPELNKKIRVAPGKWTQLFTKQIHNQVVLCNQNGDCEPRQLHQKKGWYSGVEYQYGIRVYKVP